MSIKDYMHLASMGLVAGMAGEVLRLPKAQPSVHRCNEKKCKSCKWFGNDTPPLMACNYHKPTHIACEYYEKRKKGDKK